MDVMEGFPLQGIPSEIFTGICEHISAQDLGHLLLTGNKVLCSKLDPAVRSVILHYGPGILPTWPKILFASLSRIEHVSFETRELFAENTVNIYESNLTMLPRGLKTIKIGIVSFITSKYPKSRNPDRKHVVGQNERISNILDFDIASQFPQLEHLDIEKLDPNAKTNPNHFPCASLPLVSLKLYTLSPKMISQLPSTLTYLKLLQLVADDAEELNFPANLETLSVHWFPTLATKRSVLSKIPHNLQELEMGFAGFIAADLATIPRSLKSLWIGTHNAVSLSPDEHEDFANLFPPQLVHLSLSNITIPLLDLPKLPKTLKTLRLADPIDETLNWEKIPSTLVELSSSFVKMMKPHDWKFLPRTLRRISSYEQRKEQRTFEPNWPCVTLPANAQYLPDLPPNLEYINLEITEEQSLSAATKQTIKEQLKLVLDPNAFSSSSTRPKPFEIVLPPGLKAISIIVTDYDSTIQEKLVNPALLLAFASHPHKVDVSVSFQELNTKKAWEHPLAFLSTCFMDAEGKKVIRKNPSELSSSSGASKRGANREIANLKKIGIETMIEVPKSWIRALPDTSSLETLIIDSASRVLTNGTILRYMPSSLTRLAVRVETVSEGDLCSLPRGLVSLVVQAKKAAYPLPDLDSLPRSLIVLLLPSMPNSSNDFNWVIKFYSVRPHLPPPFGIPF